MLASEIRQIYADTWSLAQQTTQSVLGWATLQQILAAWSEQRPGDAPTYTDTLPALACYAAGGDPKLTIPLCAFWSLHVLAARIFDDIQDDEGHNSPWQQGGLELALPVGLSLLKIADVCLTQLECERTTFRVIVAALNEAWACAAKSQSQPPTNLSLDDYYRTIGASSGALFAAVCWAAGNLVTDDLAILGALQTYGFSTGMMIAILNDCRHLSPRPNGDRDDLSSGLRKLPVIYAASHRGHHRHKRLMALLHAQPTLEHVSEIRMILDEMGAVVWSLQVAAEHRQNALRALDAFPSERVQPLVKYVCN